MISNKDEFLDDVFNKVLGLKTSDILERRIDVIRKGGSAIAYCPFHHDKHLGSFQISDAKGIFKCFSCVDKGGNGIKFIALKDGINYVEAAMKIALEFGFITVSEHEWFFKRKFSDEKSRKIEKVHLEKTKIEANNIASEDVLNKVYSVFVEGETLIKKEKLNEKNREYLKDRGFSDEEIEYGGYFTLPSKWIMNPLLKELKARYGINEDVLKNIPGFYKEIEKQKTTFAAYKGIGLPIKNAKGEIVAIQIRRDYVSEGKLRYIWESSSFTLTKDNLSDGTSPGSPVDVFYPSVPKEDWLNTIFITEGKFKAHFIAKTFECPVISVQGVSNWKDVNKAIKEMQNLHNNRFKFIFISFDADMAYNDQIFIQAQKMTDKIKNEFENLKICYCLWNPDYGKGIDDIIQNGQKHMIDKISKKSYEDKYLKFKTMVEKKEKIDFSKVDSDKLKKHFTSEILSTLPKYKNLAVEKLSA